MTFLFIMYCCLLLCCRHVGEKEDEGKERSTYVPVSSYKRVVRPATAAATGTPAPEEDIPAPVPTAPADDAEEDVDLGIVSTAIVDTNGTGVEARHVKRVTLNALFTLHVGVGATPVNEFDKCGELLAGAFPVLFPYGVGAPGMLTGRPKGSTLQSVSVHDDGQYLLQHRDGRFASHRLFLFALFNMIQRRAACYSAKAITKHKDFHAVQEQLEQVTDEQMKSCLDALDAGVSLDTALSHVPEVVGRLLSKIKIVGPGVPGSAHARRKLLPQLYAMVHTLGPPALFVTINPHDYGSPVLMHWATGKGDLDAVEPMRGVELQRLKVVAESPALAARFFNECCLAFHDMVLGQGNGGAGVFGQTSGFYGVSEAQGRGTLHCHYVVWLAGSGTSDGVRERVRREGADGPFRSRLLQFYDRIICTTVKMTTPAPAPSETSAPQPVYCRPPDLSVPTDADSEAVFTSGLQADAVGVALRSNMHNPDHTFTCFKGGKRVCRFGFPKDLREATTFDDDMGGIVGQRDDAYLNSFNPFIASVLRCNHDVK